MYPAPGDLIKIYDSTVPKVCFSQPVNISHAGAPHWLTCLPCIARTRHSRRDDCIRLYPRHPLAPWWQRRHQPERDPQRRPRLNRLASHNQPKRKGVCVGLKRRGTVLEQNLSLAPYSVREQVRQTRLKNIPKFCGFLHGPNPPRLNYQCTIYRPFFRASDRAFCNSLRSEIPLRGLGKGNNGSVFRIKLIIIHSMVSSVVSGSHKIAVNP